MRTVTTISLPKTLALEVERTVRRAHFASKSEFFRHLLREWNAGKLAAELEEGRREYRKGKTKTLKSMKKLW